MIQTTEKILVGDIGGTNVRLGMAGRGINGALCVEQIHKLPGDDYSDLNAAISHYLNTLNFVPKSTALALAGPIENGCVTLTNRGWTICQKDLSRTFGFNNVQLYNDFSAMARSVPECSDDDFKVLNQGTPDPDAPILVAGPGTGFGMAILVPKHGIWQVLSSEGGHQAYAPQSRLETDILHILQKDTDFVSLELVSSGHGMDAVHKAVCERLGQPYKRLTPMAIRDLAVAGDRACLNVCEIRANAIMGVMGDMALATGARGGVVLAGGVAKRLLEFINTPTAMERYYNRGPRRSYVKNIPVKLLEKPATALYGVAALSLDQDNDR